MDSSALLVISISPGILYPTLIVSSDLTDIWAVIFSLLLSLPCLLLSAVEAVLFFLLVLSR